VTVHSSLEDSTQAFATGSILIVPLRIASGVRMKILEAWARGVPVVATPSALAGLEVEDGREALAAADAAGFARALARLRNEPALAASLVEAGRRSLRERHDPARLAGELLAVYEDVAAG
jgi:glycosyltransferase involved in cell wall biosynthesis